MSAGKLNRDSLTEAEFEEALGLAQTLMRCRGVNDFLAECENMAKNRYLTRKQLEALRRDLARGPRLLPAERRRMKIMHPPSKRPITLAGSHRCEKPR